MRVFLCFVFAFLCAFVQGKDFYLNPSGDLAPQLTNILAHARDTGEEDHVYPTAKYNDLDTDVVLRPRPGEDRVQVNVVFHLPWWGFSVRHTGVAVKLIHVKQSRFVGFNLTLNEGQDGLVGHDQAGEGGQGSSSYVTWERCYVWAKGRNQRDWRVGLEGNDFCLDRWIGCSASGVTNGATDEDRIADAAKRGNVGWLLVGGNTLNLYWESCGTNNLAYGLQFQGGGSASRVVNLSASWCATVAATDAGYDLAIDGRFERCGVALMVGPPFNVTAGQGRIEASLTLAAMVPQTNRLLGIGENGEVIGLHGANRARLSIRGYGWLPSNPIVLASSGTGASLDLAGGFVGWDPATINTATRGTWGPSRSVSPN